MPLIEPKAKAPNFSLKDHSGKVHTLADFKGRPLVLYFYPKDDTSGCTDEACQFRDALPKFTTAQAAVVGVSPDDQASHAKFVTKHKLNFTLLADPAGPNGEPPVCAAFGVWQEKSMYGRAYMGVARTTFLIAPDGTIAARWDKVKVAGHAAEVLDAVKKLASGQAVEVKAAPGSIKEVIEAAKPAKSVIKPASKLERSKFATQPSIKTKGGARISNTSKRPKH